MLSTKQRLICLAVFAAMTTACSTGSGLSAGTTNSASDIPGSGGTETPKEKFEKVDLEKSTVAKLNKESEGGSAESAPEPEYGYSIASPFTGGKTYDGLTDEQKETNASINTAVAKTNSNADDYDTLTFINSPEEQKDGATKQVTITKEGFSSQTYSEKDTKDYYPLMGDIHDDIKDNMVLVIESDAPYTTLKMVEFDHTKAGAVFDGGNENGTQYANIFYRGKDASELVPSGGKAQYNGSWEVVRKVENKASGANAGYGVGADLNKRAAAKFTVDFSNKSISGDLNKTEAQGQAFAYELEGTINGNTFTADATSTTEATNEDKAKVTGGFFGEQAAELAGKLISENAAGVFAAKRDEGVDLTKGEPVPKVIYNKSGAANLNEANEFVTNFKDVLANTTKLPNVNTITLNGVTIDLLTQTDSVFTDKDKNLPLQFTRIGAVKVDKDEPLYTYFYQGQLTQAMPTTGEASYEGYWMGSGHSHGEKATAFSVNKDDLAQIKFKANFADKVLTGEFIKPDSTLAAMTLQDVTITNNTFAGKAKIADSGLNLNTGSLNNGTPIKGTVDISGGFFGDNANELGGQFSKEDNSFAGVFAGKETERTK